MENEINNYEFSRTAIDAAPIGITIFDENFQIIECNDTIINLLETSKQYYTEHFMDLSPVYQPNGDRSKEKAGEILKRTFNGENHVFEWTFLTATGELIPFEITSIRTMYKGKYAALCYQYDLRHIKHMTEEVKKQSELLKERLRQQELISEISRSFISSDDTRLLVDEAIAKIGNYYRVSNVVIFSLDYGSGDAEHAYQWSETGKKLKIKKININQLIKASFPERLYDIATVPIISCADTSLSKIDDLKELITENANAFICAPLYVEGRLWGIISVEQSHTPRHWTDNEKSFVAITASTIAGAIMLDIYNTKIKDAITKATATSKAKSEFLSNMSHEMRTPMNAIINMTKIAKNTSDTERISYALEKIGDASSHLLGVINDILDMSKIEANKFELVPVEFDFERNLWRVVNIVNFRVEEKHQKLIVQIDKEIPKMLIGDDQRLSQVITNLLNNAVKFTPENGSINLNAQFLGEENGACQIKIAVSDTGIGISKEHQKHLFKSFQQAESNTARKYGGTGLGLSISKSFVELMGGKIWVESEYGTGSTFVFTVKMQRGNGLECGKEQKETWNEDDNDFTGHRVLLVEDMEINREIVLMLLESTSLEIDCAVNGLQAVEMFIEEPSRYEVILMDVHMPGMDGYEATHRIRLYEKKLQEKNADGFCGRVPIIAMTANAFKEDIENCLNAGMDDHIGKPIDIEIVMDKLRRHLKGKPS
ncbi:MAG: ATP-binding protein [Treponema sp.]|nr:ATP-binding protein [Treponema sp.]